MPKSPIVKFNIVNNNVETTTPQDGVSQVVAVTSKGKIAEPDILVRTLQEFRNNFGYELVPDMSVSNIETALRGGSILRISRVQPNFVSDLLGTFPFTRVGVAQEDLGLATGEIDPEGQSWVLDFVGSDSLHTYVGLKAKNQEEANYDFSEQGLDITLGQLGDSFAYAMRTRYNPVNSQVYIQILNQRLDQVVVDWADNVVTEIPVPISRTGTNVQDFFNTLAEYFQLSIATELPTGFVNAELSTITTVNDLITYLTGNNTAWAMGSGIIDSDTLVDITKTYYVMGEPLVPANTGFQGRMYQIGRSAYSPTTTNLTDWRAAFDVLLDYEESYQVILSHIHQHVEEQDELFTLYRDIRVEFEQFQDNRLFIEIPKENKTDTEIVSWLEEAIARVGESKWVAYFGGGVKYYDNFGTLRDSDVLGSVLGLADTTATTAGQWYHFSGLNRGIVSSAAGIVAHNYGTSSRYNQLNNIAMAKGNMMVIKNTPTSGKQVVQWHNFTSQARTDSFRFLGVVGLVLYIKKNFRPILQAGLEEPNSFPLWNKMYYQLLPIITDLVANQGITADWEYLGDQFATNYAELQVNTEAEVRQGRYKAIFKFREIVALQEITMDLVLDASTGQATVTIQ